MPGPRSRAASSTLESESRSDCRHDILSRRMRSTYWITFPLCLSLFSSVITGGVAQLQEQSPTSNWSGFRGPDRDGVYRGPIRVAWEGLAPMWKKPIGGGRSSFAAADGRAFTIEQRKNNEVVTAYDVMTGRELWTNAWPERFTQWMGGGEGPRATPAYADGFVFALGARGELRCLDAASGRLVWRTNILKDAGAKNLRWGMAASPLISGDAVVVLPGGSAGKSVAAYDRRTGKRLWTALDDKQGYVAPMQVTLLGVPQFLIVSARRVMGLSLDRRDVLWEFPWSTDHDANAAQPVVIGDNRVFYSSGYGTGAVVVELTKSGERFAVREVWRNIRMKNRQSSKPAAGWRCLTPRTRCSTSRTKRASSFSIGWDMDAAAAVRLHVFKRLYVEVEDKLVYVRYFGIKVDRGTADHSVQANEFVVSAGMAFR